MLNVVNQALNIFLCLGEISVYDSRLSIFGAIQPGPLGDLLNREKKDNQGFFDRFLLFAASEVAINN
jgi:hypothetical protein